MKRYFLYLAWLLAAIGTLISLYFSEVRHIEPCNLCWYQRICLYPLALILAIAAYLGDVKIVRYTLPLAIIGTLFACYQILIQEIPGFELIHMCGAGPSCSEKINIGLGFITIPMLSALNFLAITTLLFSLWLDRTRKALKSHI